MNDLEIIKELETETGLIIEEALTELTQDWNSPNGYVLEDSFVKELKLSGSRLKQFPKSITRLKKLKKLYLWGNFFIEVPKLDILENLEDLDLSNNMLSNLSFLEGLKMIKYLDLEGNSIKDISQLRYLSELETLNLSENNLTTLAGLKNLHKLKSLSLDTNEINSLTEIDEIPSLIKLDLGDNLLTDISSIENLYNLEVLNLQDNKLTEINGIIKLKKLRNLDIWGNNVKNIAGLNELVNLEELDLWGNDLTDISDLSNLTKLHTLNLSKNKVQNFTPLVNLSNLNKLINSGNNIWDLNFLKNLKNLKFLSLDENQIDDISTLENLINLEVIMLSNNKIKDSSILGKLIKLKNIIIYNNEIEDITFLNSLKNVEDINFGNNKISNILILKECESLVNIDLSKNNISDISSLEKLPKLKKLNLAGNKITILPTWIVESGLENHQNKINFNHYERFYHNHFIEGYWVKDNPIENIPLEILLQDNEAIKDYLKSLENGSQPINEIKVILLGEGAAGKTSLMNYLKGKTYVKGQPQTHGINLEECTESNGVTLKIWDFGGQDIMHHTHQFFLTQKSIYLLVLNARENTDTEKWLKLIQVFGGDSPIIIVTNKIDENPSDHENIKYLNTKYPNINNRYARISCEMGIGLDNLKILLSETIKELLHVRTLWGYSWLGVKKELEEMRNGESLKDYIHFDKYEEICDKHGVTKSHRDTLINWLHQLGVITYFSDNNLSETNVINPSWLTEAFYKIINSQLVADNFGRFNLENLTQILDKYKYPSYKYNYLIGLMTKFELCYKIDDNNFLIPDLLNKEEPEFIFNFKNSLKFKIKYSNLLPKAVLPKFMVRRHSEIKSDIRWRTGLLIADSYYDSEALIRVDEEDKEISIFVNGEEKRGYLASIISNLENINSLYEGLERERLVPCNCNHCKNIERPFYFKYDILKRLKNKGKKTHTCEISTDDISINELLGVLLTIEDLEKEVIDLVGKGSFQTKKFIESGNIEGFMSTVKSLFSSVSYLLFEKTEKAYHTPLFILLKSIFSSGARADEIQAKGRADIIINIKEFLYVLELKLDGTVDEAIEQIHLNKYYEPYILDSKKVILLGINFSSKERNVAEYKYESYKINQSTNTLESI